MSRVGRHTLIYGAGMMLSRAISFVMLPVYTRYLTPADYGVMELIGTTLDLIAIIAGARIAAGIFRYYYKTDDEREKKAVVSTAFFALAISYFLIGGITYAFAAPLAKWIFGTQKNVDLVRIAAITLGVSGLLATPLSYSRLRNHSLVFVAANALKLVVGLGFNILFVVYLGIGVKGVFIANLIATSVVGLALSVYVLREVGIHYSRASTRNLLRYGLPLVVSQVALFIITFGDRYFLQASQNTSVVGLYSLAYQFGFLLAMIGYMPFEAVWEPARFAIAKRPDKDEVLARGFVYMNVVFLTIATALALFVPDVLRVMTTPDFYSAANVVPVILVAYVLQGWVQMHDIGLLVRERTELGSIANWIAAGVAILGYATLIPRYAAMGAALATLFAFAARYAIIYTLSQRLWPVRYRWAPVLRLAAIACAVGAIGYFLPQQQVLASVSTRLLLFAGYLVLAWNAGVLSAEERQILRNGIFSPGTVIAALRS